MIGGLRYGIEYCRIEDLELKWKFRFTANGPVARIVLCYADRMFYKVDTSGTSGDWLGRKSKQFVYLVKIPKNDNRKAVDKFSKNLSKQLPIEWRQG